jgi:nucleoside phosphorylase
MVEQRVARGAGARAALVGLGAARFVPDGPLVSFGFAGGLTDQVAPGELLSAARIVDEDGNTIWEGEPLPVPGARSAVFCWSDEVVDKAAARHALAARSGAEAVDMESGALAATGRLTGVLRAVTDSPAQPVGTLAGAGREDGSTDWMVVARSFASQPLRSVRTARNTRKAIRALGRAARELS